MPFKTPWIAAPLISLLISNAAWAQANTLTLTERKESYVVDTGGKLVFEISRKSGDLTSLKFNGRECTAPYGETKRYSHYASGLSGDSAISAEKDAAGQWVKITVDDPKIGVTHYYMARKGEANLYMATYAEKSPPPGEMRFLFYLDRRVFKNVPAPSDNSPSDGGVEGKDVFKNTKTGTTTSKFYGAKPAIDGGSHGVSGDGVLCVMNQGNRETSSGGPFFRDIENQSGDKAGELYNYMFSGHTQTEPFRPGLKGPYVVQFTDGKPPAAADFSFIAKLGLKGYVPAAGRGTIEGRVSGLRKDGKPVVALANDAAQYWARPDTAGKYAIKNVLPGTYAVTLYDNELGVAKKTVAVTATKVATADLSPTWLIPPAVFRIGTWDGTPNEFLNADRIADCHPSDSRMKPFTNGNFVVGKSKDIDWPLGQWKSVNNERRITFDLSAEQAKTPLTLRVGVTITYNNGRPFVVVNGGQPGEWKSKLPEPSDQPKQSRGITRGTYRGNNDVFAVDVPPASLHAGTNTIDLRVESGTKSYDGFLSPNIVFDAVDLVTTADARRAEESRIKK